MREVREMGRAKDVAAILHLTESSVYRLASQGVFAPGVFQGRGLYCLSNLVKRLDDGTLFLRKNSNHGVNEATLAIQEQLKNV